MNRNLQSVLTTAFGILLFVVGGLLNLLMFIQGAWPTTVFFLLMAVGLVTILLGVWGWRNWLRPEHPPGFLKRNVALLAFLFIAAVVAVWVTQVDVTRHFTYQMTWRYEGARAERPASKHIVLSFVDYPNHYIGIYSTDLGAYLESLGTDRVPVVFEVTCDFGRVRALQEVQIGELTQWQSDGGHAGSTGANQPSPWRCK